MCQFMGDQWDFENDCVLEARRAYKWCAECVQQSEGVTFHHAVLIARTPRADYRLIRSRQIRQIRRADPEVFPTLVGSLLDPAAVPPAERAHAAATAVDLVWTQCEPPPDATPAQLEEWEASKARRRARGLAALDGHSKRQRTAMMFRVATQRALYPATILDPIQDLLVLAWEKDKGIALAVDALADFLVLQEATLSEDEAAARLETLRLDIRSRMADRIHPLPNLSPEQRDRMDLAADYTDQWYSVGEGDRRVAFRTWYVCGRKWGDRRCNTLTLSAHWQRRHGDPLATGQRWYCPVCQARYKTGSGVLVEFVGGDCSYYLRADFPPKAIQEVKWASVQRGHGGALTPEALLAAIPDAAPASACYTRRVEGVMVNGRELSGVYMYDEDALAQIPRLDWTAILEHGNPSRAAPPQGSAARVAGSLPAAGLAPAPAAALAPAAGGGAGPGPAPASAAGVVIDV